MKIDPRAELPAEIARVTEPGHDETASSTHLACLPSGSVEVIIDRPNSRTKIIGVEAADLDSPLVQGLVDLTDDEDSNFDKLVLYARDQTEVPWVRAGFLREAELDGFFVDGTPAQLWARFGSRRERTEDEAHHHEVVAGCLEKTPAPPAPMPRGLRYRIAGVGDAARIGRILRETFPEYPSRLDDMTLASKIRSGTSLFAVIETSMGSIVAVASAEMDHERQNAEMTDCATLPEHRGQGLMRQLLWRLEQDLATRTPITSLYTLARAGEFGMNATFARLGYSFTGRLINNCRMPTGWESVNAWCRNSAVPLRVDG